MLWLLSGVNFHWHANRFLYRFAAENKLSDDRLFADGEHDGLSVGASDDFNPTLLDKFSQPLQAFSCP
jgi:hypothetical protein